jgi:hypothetical protein
MFVVVLFLSQAYGSPNPLAPCVFPFLVALKNYRNHGMTHHKRCKEDLKVNHIGP